MVRKKSKKDTTPINTDIRATEVMLIDSDGEKLGMMPFEDALAKARDKLLDLVQVSSNESNPIVCKLLDFNKHIFQKKKNVSSSPKKSRKNPGPKNRSF